MSYDYDEQIRRLEHAGIDAIHEEWGDGEGLFQYANRSGGPEIGHDHSCGCLTQIRRDEDRAVPGRPDLTDAIRADERIPSDAWDITAKHLPVFKEWQKRLDRELRGAE